MTEEIEIKLKRVRNVMNNFEDLLCEDMQNEVDEIKEYIEKQQKELDKKDKIINLFIDDFQAENYFVNMTNKEVLEYYEKRKELK